MRREWVNQSTEQKLQEVRVCVCVCARKSMKELSIVSYHTIIAIIDVAFYYEKLWSFLKFN